MASKVQSPGPSSNSALAARQARPKKAAIENAPKQASVGRAGSAGGIVLEKEMREKTTAPSVSKPTTAKPPAPETSSTTAPKSRRKPRKLNKDPTPTSATTTTTAASPAKPASAAPDTAASAELEALKSRVRGLEAKVEQLYSTTSGETKTRSPRRRGKGRKTSSATQVPTLSGVSGGGMIIENEGEEEVDNELVRLEGELEVARQDLEAFRPRTRRTKSQESSAGGGAGRDDDIEEIPRGSSGATGGAELETRQVTLSGSYRIPLPTSVSLDDVKSIQSGVAAAQNVARSFLEQRRGQQINPTAQGSSAQAKTTTARAKKPASPRLSSSMEVAVATGEDGEKQTWGEWIGGYSMAISRAVKNIEHEAAVESQRGSTGGGGGGGGAGGARRGKRPGVKTGMSGEDVKGLTR